jgi:hypothetical protein
VLGARGVETAVGRAGGTPAQVGDQALIDGVVEPVSRRKHFCGERFVAKVWCQAAGVFPLPFSRRSDGAADGA